jgi:hypothetical protein
MEAESLLFVVLGNKLQVVLIREKLGLAALNGTALVNLSYLSCSHEFEIPS